MAFTRQQPFSKKTTDLPDVPSPAYTPTQIKEYIETPSDENKSFVDSFLNELEADTGAASVGAKKADGTASDVQTALDEKQTKTALSNVTGATLVGAKKGDGTTSTVQVALDEKAVKGGDWTGTWQGFSPSQVDQTIRDKVNTNTSQLADIAKDISQYSIQTPEADDTGRLQRAINDISSNNLVLLIPKSVTLNVSGDITIPTGTKIFGQQKGGQWHDYSTINFTNTTEKSFIVNGVDDAVIEGLTFKNTVGYAIKVITNSQNVCVLNNRFATDKGVYLYQSVYIDILFNAFMYNTTAVMLSDQGTSGNQPQAIRVKYNKFRYCDDCIYSDCGYLAGNDFNENNYEHVNNYMLYLNSADGISFFGNRMEGYLGKIYIGKGIGNNIDLSQLYLDYAANPNTKTTDVITINNIGLHKIYSPNYPELDTSGYFQKDLFSTQKIIDLDCREDKPRDLSNPSTTAIKATSVFTDFKVFNKHGLNVNTNSILYDDIFTLKNGFTNASDFVIELVFNPKTLTASTGLLYLYDGTDGFAINQGSDKLYITTWKAGVQTNNYVQCYSLISNEIFTQLVITKTGNDIDINGTKFVNAVNFNIGKMYVCGDSSGAATGDFNLMYCKVYKL